MLRITLKLDPIVTMHQRRTFGILMLFRDIGGISFFIYLIVTPSMNVLVGNKYYNSLFKQIFWVNEVDPDTI